MFKYFFLEEEYNKCKEFSEKIDTSFYSTRSQTNNNKRKKDQLVGKLGEILCFNYLKNKITDLSYPDFNIYEKNKKSWDFDLKAVNYNIHVKSQDVEQGLKYGESWLFQNSGSKFKGYDKEIFDKTSQNQYICFCMIDLKEKFGLIKAIVSLDYLHNNNLFKYPKLEILKINNKLAVYFDDIGEKNMIL
jgi:hypothetical protein